MKKSTAVILAIFLIGACVYDAWAAHQEAIKALRNDKVNELKASVDPEEYRDAEKAEIEEILAASEKTIMAAEEEAEMDSVIKDAAGKFSGLKTDAQYTKEEEEARKQAELERKRREEEAARQAAEAAAAAAAASRRSSGGGSSGSSGCVGNSADNFY